MKAKPVRDERSESGGLRALDARAITAIHNQYFPELYRYAKYRLSDSLAAEDVASEVFVRLLEAVVAGAGPRSSLRGWLIGTAAHLINDRFRKNYKQPMEVLPNNVPSNKPDPSKLAEQMDRERTVHTALSLLTHEQQHVLALRFGGSYSLKETAAIMRKRPNAIKALQFRALAALRRQLGEDVL